jgi:putative SOS response-associated peptidase YedK
MCGRYHLIASGQRIRDHFGLLSLPTHHPDYNIPPGQKVLAIVQLENGSSKAVHLHWGLIPSWAKDRAISNRLINARAETLAEKASFKNAFRRRRCLIPATGFFEWRSTESGKQPYHIHTPDNDLFAFGGIWEHWEQDQETVYSCAIITTTANDKISAIHNRMPVIIASDDYSRWLDRKNAVVGMTDFLAADAYASMEVTPISTRINNPQHNDESCLR